jgi:uncharacterized protein (DUF111 family)
MVLEANVDDVTGETLAHAVEVILGRGALDCWLTPIVMKKGRPAHQVSVLCDPALAAQLAADLRSETGSLGVRAHGVTRWASTRTIAEVRVEGMSVRVKVSPGRVKAEHDDAARAAARLGRPLIEVVSLAEETWRRENNVVPFEGPGAGDGPDGGDDDVTPA